MHRSRAGGVARLILLGVVSGFTLYIVSDLADEFGKSGMAPAILAAWAPVAAALLLATTLLLHLEDG